MTITDGRKPSLDNALARIARAREHIKSLEAEVGRWSMTGPLPGHIETATVSFTPSPLCSILIGEIAYNLKAALDYLVFELFYLATGDFNNDTKFVIEQTPAEWNNHFPKFDTLPKREKKLWLHKLKAEHQAVLKGLQPFSGTTWTASLQRITNPDRHRELIRIAGAVTYTKLERLSDARSQVVRDAGLPLELFVHFEVATNVTLKDGVLAIEAMKHLVGEVANVIQGFERDFE